MTGRRVEREQSWDSLRVSIYDATALRQSDTNALTQRSDILAEEDGYFQEEQEMEDGQEPALMTLGEVHRALHPLKETADRVGRQVESFAEALDRLNPHRKGKKNIQVKDVLPLVRQYEKIAAKTVQQLKHNHERERQELLQKSFSRRLRKESGLSTPTEYYQEEPDNPHSTTVEDLNHWELERQTWQLLALMMEAQSGATDVTSSDLPPNLVQPRDVPRPHRYSTERKVWDYFLEQKPEMWEKHVVVEWLKSNAMSAGQDIDSIVDQLQSGDNRGTDLWNSGWLYSKEAIKHQKRLRSWPQPLDPASAAVGSSLIQAGTSEGQITQLDPDAFSRQGRLLAKEDVFFERAIWLACWEMIRRGYSADDIRTWSKDHRELWRSLSLCGDPRPAYDSEQSHGASSWQSRTLWRKMCFKLARDGGMDEYERAVYGALSGDLASVQKVARTWDDMLFAYYNSQLLQGFDLYVQNTFPERVQAMKPKGRGNEVPSTAVLEGGQIWDLLLQSQLTKEEALNPLKLLQGSIIAKRAGGYLVAQAYALSQVLMQGNPEMKKLARVFQHKGQDPTAPIQLSSYDLLRIFTHVAFALQDIGQLDSNAQGIEQIVIAYVDFLGKAGKQQLLPLYASRLTSDGAIECMARQLPSITDHNERKTMLNLMHGYSMDVPATLLMQLVLITQDHPVDPNAQLGFPPLRILDSTSTTPGTLPNIKSDFIGDEIAEEEWDLISGMEWYLLLDKHWKETMYAGSLVYKYLFLTGSLAAARELSRRVPFRIISLNKTERILGESIDLEIFSDGDNSAPPSPDKRRRAGTKGRQGTGPTPAQRSFLLSESSTFRDLEALIRALDAIENFASIASQRVAFGTDARHAKDWKDQLQTASDAASAAVEPLLEPGWLADPSTPRESAELAALRAAYLPELLLAYISLLGVCGQVLSRDVLLRGLDLAALIAGSGDEGAVTGSHARNEATARRKTDSEATGELARCFVRAGRMAELVNALTALSRLIVMADEAGGRKSRRSGRRSTKAAKAPSDGLGIWSVHTGVRSGGE